MKFSSRLPSIAMVCLALLAGAVFLPSLSGCVMDGTNPVGRWMSSITGTYGLPSEAVKELSRFRDTYAQKSMDDGTQEKQFQQFIDAFKVVRSSYVTEVSDRDLITYAIEGLNDKDDAWLNADDGTSEGVARPSKVVEVALDRMMAQLDPHSGYMTPEEFQELMVDTSGEFGGLGIEVQQGEGFLRVVSPIEDTPAFHAGLLPEDKITHINGVSIKEWTLVKTVRTLRGKPGSEVTVTIEREGRKAFDVAIVRDIIQVKAVKYAFYDDYLHLRVVAFSERTEMDVLRAFDDAEEKLGDNLKGVVLDLRNNPGGLLQQSVALSDIFLEEGSVVSIRGRSSDDVRTFGAQSGDLARGLPVVVLVNEGSASASEIVSGALQDHNRAILMGRKTFGKGSVQTIMPLIRDGAVRLTTALYYLPSGRTIQKVGVSPDIRLDLPVEKEEVKKPEEENAEHLISREEDLPNVLNAKTYHEDRLHNKEGILGHASVQACPEMGTRKDRELGCAIEFLKAGTAQRFIARLNVSEKG